jgi:outer membrane protein assembly factor BamE (lipoprotein component of BamABCDE complex)
MSSSWNELWVLVGTLTLVLAGGFPFFARWCLNSPAVSKDKLDALQVGLPADKVRSLLGEPRLKRPSDNGDECWFYGAQWKRHVLVIEFAPDRTVREFIHGVPHPRRSKAHPSDH